MKLDKKPINQINQVINKGAKETKSSKHEPQTANNTRECSVSLAAKGTRGKMILRFCVTLASMLPVGKQATNARKEVDRSEPFRSHGGNVRQPVHYGNPHGGSTGNQRETHHVTLPPICAFTNRLHFSISQTLALQGLL